MRTPLRPDQLMDPPSAKGCAIGLRFGTPWRFLNLRHVEQLKAEVATRRREVQTKTKELAEEKAAMLLWRDHPGGRWDPEGGHSAQRTACPVSASTLGSERGRS